MVSLLLSGFREQDFRSRFLVHWVSFTSVLTFLSSIVAEARTGGALFSEMLPLIHIRWLSMARAAEVHVRRFSSYPGPINVRCFSWCSPTGRSSHLRLLGCAGAWCIVQGVHHLGLLVVQVLFTCGGVLPFATILHVLRCWMLYCCACSCACASAHAGRVQVQCSAGAASRYIVELVRVRDIFIFYFFSLHMSIAPLVFRATFFSFFFFSSLFLCFLCTILLRVLRATVWTNDDDWSMKAVWRWMWRWVVIKYRVVLWWYRTNDQWPMTNDDDRLMKAVWRWMWQWVVIKYRVVLWWYRPIFIKSGNESPDV